MLGAGGAVSQPTEILPGLVDDSSSDEFKRQLNEPNESSLYNFTTVSNVDPNIDSSKHITPEEIFEILWQTDNAQWNSLIDSQVQDKENHSSLNQKLGFCNSSSNNDFIGKQFLNHNNHLKDLNITFQNLNPEFAECKKNQQQSSLISSDQLLRVTDEESEKKSGKQKQKTSSRLSDELKEVYRYAIKSAAHFVLSPNEDDIGETRKATNFLVAKVFQAFCISLNIHKELYRSIVDDNKTKSLVEDLYDLKERILNDNLNGKPDKDNTVTPVYSEENFKSPEHYGIWKETQLNRVERLIQENVPAEFADNIISHSFDLILGYKKLLEKLFIYDLEHVNTDCSETTSGDFLPTILQTDSNEILEEYSLRFGVPDSFRRICFFDLLVSNLQYSEWYLELFHQKLKQIQEFLRREIDYTTNQEKTIFVKCLPTLKNFFHCCFIIMCREDFKGFDTLIFSLQKYLDICREFSESFNLASSELQTFEEVLKLSFKKAAESIHAEEKKQKKSLSSAEFLCILKNCFDKFSLFQETCRNSMALQNPEPYMIEVAVELYSYLMDDFAEVCCNEESIEVKLVDCIGLFSLCFQLNKLDKMWKDFIPKQRQKWRMSFRVIINYTNPILLDRLHRNTAALIDNDDMSILKLESIDTATDTIAIANDDKPPTPNPKSSLLATPKIAVPHPTPSSSPLPSSFRESPSSAFTRLDRRQSKQKILAVLRRGSRVDVLGQIGDEDGHSLLHSTAPPSPSSSCSLSASSSPPATVNRSFAPSDGVLTTKNLPLEGGSILITKGTVDLLLTAFRLIDLMKRICDLTFPLDCDGGVGVGNNDVRQDFEKLRKEIAKIIFKNVSTLFNEYASTLVSLDFCGSDYYKAYFKSKTSNIAKTDDDKFIQEVEATKAQEICGCRHALKYPPASPEHRYPRCMFLNLLLEKSFGWFEVIPKEMCYRINNIWSLIRLLPLIQKKSFNALKVNEKKEKPEEQKDERIKDERNFDDEEKDEREKGSELRECHSYLKKISEFQIRMLASRAFEIYSLNFDELYRLRLIDKDFTEQQMDPCLSFLRHQLDLFKQNLYEEVFERVIFELWELIIKKFEELFSKLCDGFENPKKKAKKLDTLLRQHCKMIQDILKGTVNHTIPHGLQDEIYSRKITVLREKCCEIFFLLEIFHRPSMVLFDLWDYATDKNDEKLEMLQNIIMDPENCNLTFEECYYEIKKELAKPKATFSGYEMLEYLSPGWLQRQIALCEQEPFQRQELIQSLKSLESSRISKRERKKAEAAGQMSQRIISHRDEIGQMVLSGLTKSKIPPNWKDLSADQRALIVLMKFYMNKDNEDNEDECYVLGITNREPNQHLCEFAKRFVSIEDENSNRAGYGTDISVRLHKLWTAKTVEIDFSQVFEFADQMDNDRIPILELVGKLHSVVRSTANDSIMSNSKKAVKSALTYRTRDPQYRDEQEDIKTKLIEKAFPIKGGPLSCCF